MKFKVVWDLFLDWSFVIQVKLMFHIQQQFIKFVNLVFLLSSYLWINNPTYSLVRVGVLWLKGLKVYSNVLVKPLLCLLFIGFVSTYSDFFVLFVGYILTVCLGVFQFNYISIHLYLFLIVFMLTGVVWSAYLQVFSSTYLDRGSFILDDLNILKLTNTLPMGFGLQMSYLSVSFMFLTLLIALFANIFSSVYIRNEVNPEKFILYLNLFIISMVLLVLSSNWGVLILGWECIGISSYLLINFWVFKVSTFKAAFKAFSFNKVSDLGVIVACIVYLNVTGDASFLLIPLNKVFFLKSFYLVPSQYNLLTVFITSLSIAAACKSAQLGFHIWLPDSMEAPVPASALIHSATLVSAGIFILLKFWVIIKYSYFMYNLILVWSLCTTLYGAVVAAQQVDLKRTLAYSTISHCGYIIFSIFLENPVITVSYLYAHGFYKAFSFMTFGNIIYGFSGVQDVRQVTGIFFLKKINFFILFYTLFSLSSAPISISFLIKHSLINTFFQTYINYVFLILILLSSGTGIVYSLRILLNLFFSFSKLWSSVGSSKYVNIKKVYKYNYLCTDFNISLSLLIGIVLSHNILILFVNKNFIFLVDNLPGSIYYSISLPLNILTVLQYFLLSLALIMYVYVYSNFNYSSLITRVPVVSFTLVLVIGVFFS